MKEMGCHCGGGLDQPREVTLKVAGMSCKHCQKAVEDALKNLEGVKDVQINLEQGIVKVKYNPIEVGLQEFKKAIEDAGYEVL
ncbi:Copper ion binding protein [Syntrophaceticus schinkii]|uniref:Copper chaperone CopZ n=2 Tax=Syntrophaceticus schinkii TaxID=499207 RepID=A0A0B7MGX8_9FIRM|nr:Copper ion binding protein [Syntrophaceticus schinkii]